MEGCTETIQIIGSVQHTFYSKDGVIVAECRKSRAYGQDIIQWYRDGRPHRDGNLPAIVYYKNGDVTDALWYANGVAHRDNDLPAAVHYNNGQIAIEYWYRNGNYHRDNNAPAVIIHENGQKTMEKWYRGGKFDGNVLAYIWLADINRCLGLLVSDMSRYYKTLHEFRDTVKGPLALELMRVLPIPIRDAIYEHYCYQ